MPEPLDSRPNWLFLDMNSFFASAEQHLRKELRGRPVGVIPLKTESTCVIAASVEAKARGVRTGTSVPEARRLCPEIALVEARPPVYVETHHAVMRSIDRWLPIHRAYSIDEWAIRLTGPDRELDRATDLAQRIKRQIREDFSPWLPCSVGIAPTRLLAKIACELQKPDGLTALMLHDLPDRLEHLRLSELTGIASGMVKRLETHGVRTICDLWALTRDESVRAWGSVAGADWWAGFHGIDEPEAPTRKRSMSHANMLEPRFRTDAGARLMLTRLVSRLGIRLRSEGYLAGELHISVRYTRGNAFTSGVDLPHVNDTTALLGSLHELWDRRAPSPSPPLNVGATVSGLVLVSQTPRSLFEHDHERELLSGAMDIINSRWGLPAIYFGSMHGCCHHMDDKIAFGRIPPGMKPPAATKAPGEPERRGDR